MIKATTKGKDKMENPSGKKWNHRKWKKAFKSEQLSDSSARFLVKESFQGSTRHGLRFRGEKIANNLRFPAVGYSGDSRSSHGKIRNREEKSGKMLKRKKDRKNKWEKRKW
jgi:hypothetical protein